MISALSLGLRSISPFLRFRWRSCMTSSGNSCLKRGLNRTARLIDTLESRLLFSVFTPTQIRQAYGINGLSGDGTGQTIAIVEAYHDPNLANDLNTFDQQFSINGTQNL